MVKLSAKKKGAPAPAYPLDYQPRACFARRGSFALLPGPGHVAAPLDRLVLKMGVGNSLLGKPYG